MTKADIVNEIYKSTGIDKAAVLATIERFMDVVTIIIPEHKIPAFKPARVFMDEVKGE